MQRRDFHYKLPKKKIAQFPLAERNASRLLCLQRVDGSLADRQIVDMVELVQPGDLLVLNNTRVIAARLYGKKESGGRVEILLERVLDERRAKLQIKASKTPKTDSKIFLDEEAYLTVTGRDESFFIAEFSEPLLPLLGRHGHVPLPPYMTRRDKPSDQERYQTVFARHEGAVAAPTAGLHFDDALLSQLKEKAVQIGYLTLHVGSGTFQPLREDDPKDHVMHKEWLEIDDSLCAQVNQTRAKGGRVVAVGTTVVRGLETATVDGKLAPYQGDTDLYILPGYQYQSVDAMLTNFHVPESTLLMLVCAFAGYDNVMAAYRHALEHDYRFLSYGDAMWIS